MPSSDWVYDPETGSWGPGGAKPPTVPDVPTVPNVSAGIPNNLQTITDTVNRLNVAGQTAANQARIPGAAGLEATSSANIANQLAGKLPADFIRMLQQSGAERGVSQGISGSPNEDSAYMRALGLSSLDLMNKGQENLTAAYGRNPVAKVFNPQDYILTPGQAGQLNNQAAGINIDAILKQGGMGVDIFKALLDAQTRQAAIDASKTGVVPWWAVNQNQGYTG